MAETPRHPGPAANDASRLKPEWRVLLEQMPRERWPQRGSGGLGATWLAMHDSLRHGQRALEALARRWLAKEIDWVGFRKQALPLFDGHLGHLHGHHRLEDQQYFPLFRRAEPRLAAGFDLLDSDHQTIDASVQRLHQLQHQLAHANPAQAEAWSCAHAIVRELPLCGELLARHLADEEDLVIPLLALREGPQRAA